MDKYASASRLNRKLSTLMLCIILSVVTVFSIPIIDNYFQHKDVRSANKYCGEKDKLNTASTQGIECHE
ncbi:MAG: hypothetical protein OQJ89_11715 [Kangiellaceae bacterium]|nr:hypothetical protein [Kangiellaceae bacterium]